MLMTNYTRIFENAHRPTGKVDEAKTMKAWKERATVTRDALTELRRQYDADRDAINAKYKPTAAAERIAPLTADYEAVVAVAKKRLNDDLDSVMQAKREQLSRAQDAPTDSAVRLLSVLNMRTSISATEIAEAASKMNGNIPALLALRDIAHKHDVSFPDVAVDVIEADMEAAETFARGKIDSVAVPLKDLNYRDRLFWTSPDGEAKYFFGKVDNGFAAVLVDEPAKQPEPEAQNGHIRQSTAQDIRSANTRTANATRIFLRGNEKLSIVAGQFGITEDMIRTATHHDMMSTTTSASMMRAALVETIRRQYFTQPAVIPRSVREFSALSLPERAWMQLHEPLVFRRFCDILCERLGVRGPRSFFR